MLIKILLKYIMGYVRITIEGYYIERFINICRNNKILIWSLKREKGVKLYLNVGIQDYYKIVEISKKLKCKTKIIKKRGIPFIINRYRKRKIFILSLIIILVILYASSNYIWNIEIQTEGDEEIKDIIEDINIAGLKTGIKKDEINTQEIINKIRLKRSDISWIGINLKGTNAIVKIVKATEKPKIIDKTEYCNIVAEKTGTITKIIAQNGIAVVKEGDEVQKGQILIKGTMEGKYTGTRYVHSLGEVEAIVKHEKTEKIYYKKGENVKTGKKETKYGVKINKIKINFYKTLSKFKICDTIEEEKKIKIFSNLYLPISVVKTTNYEVKEEQEKYTLEEAVEIGTRKIEKEIEKELPEKEKIIERKVEIEKGEEYVEVKITYEVIENIGMQEKIEEEQQTEENQ